LAEGVILRAMRKRQQSSEEAPAVKEPNKSPLSLSRLRDAFAVMLGEEGSDAAPGRQVSPKLEGGSFGETALRACEINPRSVVEAILFVGRPDNQPMSARELAASMRGVSPTEIEAAVAELNSIYEADGAPYQIEQTNSGYRMALRDKYQRVRDKFYGRMKEARLSPAALEVLSVLAYHQPATTEKLNELRGAPSGAALSTLVRRRLVKLERAAEPNAPPQYSTTERFLKLFGLESLEALPRSEELERA
jgi:segregation and condensation protein B